MTPGEVRARRVGLGLTQGDVARLMGVDDRQVRRWEAGHEPAPAEMRERYAALLERRDLPDMLPMLSGIFPKGVRFAVTLPTRAAGQRHTGEGRGGVCHPGLRCPPQLPPVRVLPV